ncbi:MAG: 16S rRNA (guanine(527)-N(7))-methyltransferase RsmG, partial [Corynebacteriales bacterium]|nr:16S rRNA (guanine(527)-N(7))-methyltransferase RsmG [Mycobacteriales bacterium]
MPEQLPSAAAREVFGEHFSAAEEYARFLETAGVERGLIGPREPARLWERHLINCAVVAELIEPNAIVADIGSGAGLPGLVLAIVRPDLKMHLIEPMQRRIDFLNEAVETLGLVNVKSLRGRAEEFSGKVSADVVVSRAVAPLSKLIPWCLPLLKQGGVMLAMKGSSGEAELDEASALLRKRRIASAR